MMMTFVPRRSKMRLASATDLPGNGERVDRGSCSVVPVVDVILDIAVV